MNFYLQLSNNFGHCKKLNVFKQAEQTLEIYRYITSFLYTTSELSKAITKYLSKKLKNKFCEELFTSTGDFVISCNFRVSQPQQQHSNHKKHCIASYKLRILQLCMFHHIWKQVHEYLARRRPYFLAIGY